MPMVRDAASVTPAALAQAEQSGPALLTFNEPDLDTQANMTVGTSAVALAEADGDEPATRQSGRGHRSRHSRGMAWTGS